MVDIGILVFDGVEELDFVGPFEVLSYINKITPETANVWLISDGEQVVKAYNGLRFFADYTIDNCPHLDVLVVPGGQGRKLAMHDERILHFIKTRYPDLKYLASVCTGALILAATGLLEGKSATTYHTALDELTDFGVRAKKSKVVQADNIITGAGVSSGIDVGLYLISLLFDLDTAKYTAEKIEYNWQTQNQ